VLARGLGKKDLADAALATAQQAVEQVQQTGEGYPVAEIFRVKGELLSALFTDGDQDEEPESWYRQALEIAEKQKARSWELRAALNLAALHRDRNRIEAAIDLVQKHYSWFEEGHGTSDLSHARQFIEELAHLKGHPALERKVS
jgi:predicted ATPase